MLGLKFTEVDKGTPLTDVSGTVFRLTLSHCVLIKVVGVGAPYFAAQFDEGPQLFVRIKGRFPLQFGRCASCACSCAHTDVCVCVGRCFVPLCCCQLLRELTGGSAQSVKTKRQEWQHR